MQNQSQYTLSKTFFDNHKAVRALDQKGDFLITGSIDKTVHIYKRISNNFIHEQTIDLFDDYIYSVLISEDQSSFIIGSKDTKIYILDILGNPIGLLEGHTSAVNSLSQFGNFLVSGSWDTTAKVWDLQTLKIVQTLEGHSHAVTVLFYDKNLILTASEDKSINIWENFQKKHVIKNAHTAIIRDLHKVNGLGFLSCSNDESIKLWTLNGENLLAFESSHNSYIYSIKLINPDLYASCSEDRSVKLWNSKGAVIQTLNHPNTVWSITIDSKTNDLITACADGTVRIFTENSERFASESEIKELENSCLQAQTQQENQGLSQSELEKLKLVENRNNYPGKLDGEIRLFRNGPAAEAYLWKAESQQWEKIGDVIAGNPRKNYEGDKYFAQGEYDYVFDVDYDGIPHKLPFNEGDNPLETAEKFLAREGLGKSYVEQIVSFIKKNSRGVTKENKKKEINVEFQFFPMNSVISFEGMNLAGLNKKVLEFNQKLSEGNNLKAFSEKEMKYFGNILETLQNTSLYHSSLLSPYELDIFNKFLKWPTDYQLPVFDLLRVFLIHPQSETLSSGLNAGLGLLTDLCTVLHGLNNGNINENMGNLSLKCLCNMFKHTSNSNAMLKNSALCFDALMKIIEKIDSYNQNLVNSFYATIVNYSIALSLSFTIELTHFEQYIEILKIALIKEKSPPNLMKIIVCVGNLLLSKKNEYIYILKQNLSSHIKNLKIPISAETNDVEKAFNDLKSLF